MKDAGQPIPKTMEEFAAISKSFMKDTDNDRRIDKWGAVLNLKGGDGSIVWNFIHFLYMNKTDWFYGQFGGDRRNARIQCGFDR